MNDMILVSGDIEVTATIEAILICADESLISIQPSNGYTISICKHLDLPFYNDTINADNKLDIHYMTSRILKENIFDGACSFVVLRKSIVREFTLDELQPNVAIQWDGTNVPTSVRNYHDQELDYINTFISQLNLLKKGSIGVYKTYSSFETTTMRAFGFPIKLSSIVVDANTINQDVFCVEPNEVSDFNNYLASVPVSWNHMKQVIDLFTYSKKFIDSATRFVLLMTV